MSEESNVSILHTIIYSFDEWVSVFNESENDKDEESFVVYDNDIPCAWLKLNGLLNKNIAYISMLVVSEKYKHKGVGTFAVCFAVDYLKSKGFTRIGLHTTEDNIIAINLYCKFGFTKTKQEKRKTESGIEVWDIAMEKALDNYARKIQRDDMKTLILNGSPRKNGNSVNLINILTERLNGEYKIVDTYFANISPCVDCRHCWSYSDCSINDEMTEVYNYIEDCDNVVIVSPIYFSQPTGKLLDVCSRFQKYFAAKYFRKQNLLFKSKKGAVIFVGGGDGHPNNAYKTACTLLNHINVKDVYPLVGSFNTNERPAIEDKKAIKGIENIVNFFNG